MEQGLAYSGVIYEVKQGESTLGVALSHDSRDKKSYQRTSTARDGP